MSKDDLVICVCLCFHCTSAFWEVNLNQADAAVFQQSIPLTVEFLHLASDSSTFFTSFFHPASSKLSWLLFFLSTTQESPTQKDSGRAWTPPLQLLLFCSLSELKLRNCL